MRISLVALGLIGLTGSSARADVPRWWIGEPVAAPGANADPAIAERAARAFVDDHAATLAPGRPAWRVVANRVDGALRTVAFVQTWHGLDVVDAQISVVFGRDRIFAVASRAHPNVDVAESIAAPPARVGLDDYIVREAGDRVVIEGPHGHVLADPIEVARAHERWTLYVGLDGAIVAARDRVHRDGTLRFDVGVRRPGGERMAFPAQTVGVTVDGVAATTDANGGFASAVDPSQVVPSLVGSTVAVASAIALAPPTLSVPAGGSATWSAPTDAPTDAALSAYVHAMLGKAHARTIVPAIAAWLDTPIAITVNQTETTCDAFYDGTSLNFFVAHATCENTGRLADVVVHELGHAIHDHAVIPGQGAFDTQLSEGLADFGAADLHDDSAIGRGYYFTDAPMRDLAPPGRRLVWPADASDDPHTDGLVIGGALWDLRVLAGPAVAEIAFRGVLERAADIPSAYVAALVEDDDDANLANGTPHGCAIGEAFARHGLAPDFATTTIGIPTIVDRTIALAVATPANAACPPPAVASATIHWHTATTAGDVALTGTTTLTGTIPDQPADTLVSFTVDVTLANGTLIRQPANLADPEYTLYVGPVVRLYCASMDADPVWDHVGAWEFSALPDSPPPDPQAAHTGTGAYGTILTSNGLYPGSAHLTATLPAVDTTGYHHVHLQYYRWLTVEDGLYDRATITANGQTLWHNAIAGGTLNHLDREWRFQDVDVTPAIVNDAVAVTFALDTDAIGAFGGWTVDDVCLVATGPACGNGVVDPGEECDDGNRTADDGCSATCTVEPQLAPPDGCCSTSPPLSPLAPILLVLSALWRRARPRDRGHRDRSPRARRSTSSDRADRRRSRA